MDNRWRSHHRTEYRHANFHPSARRTFGGQQARIPRKVISGLPMFRPQRWSSGNISTLEVRGIGDGHEIHRYRLAAEIRGESSALQLTVAATVHYCLEKTAG